jgi:hypothetical protein
MPGERLAYLMDTTEQISCMSFVRKREYKQLWKRAFNYKEIMQKFSVYIYIYIYIYTNYA